MDKYYREKQSDETREKRDDYYESLAEDISRMIAQDVSEELFRELGVIGDDPIDQKWRDNAEQDILDSFDDFKKDDFWAEITQVQLDALFAHFTAMIADGGEDPVAAWSHPEIED